MPTTHYSIPEYPNPSIPNSSIQIHHPNHYAKQVHNTKRRTPARNGCHAQLPDVLRVAPAVPDGRQRRRFRANKTKVTASPAAGPYGGTVNLSATLTTHGSGNTPISGQIILFTLGGTSVGTATTNSQGVATFSNASLGSRNAGTYAGAVGASFAGNTSLAADASTADLTVTKATSSITEVSGSGVFASTATLTAKLTPSVSGQTILFTIGGTSVGSATTNSSGVATLSNANLGSRNAGTYTGAVGASVADNTNYTASSGTGTLTVTRATATITLGALSQAFDGSAKSATATTTPAGLAGISVSHSQNGAAVTAPINAGSYDVVASLNNANYTAANATGVLEIAKASQTITFAPLADKAVGDASSILTASATSGLPVSFSVSGPASLSGNTLSITGAGDVTVTASQAGSVNYNAAAPVVRSFTVTSTLQEIAWSNPANIAFGTELSGTQLNATLTKGDGALTYQPAAGTKLGVGSHTLTVTAAATTNFKETSKSVTITVHKADQTITFSNPGEKTFGDEPFVLGATSSSGLPVAYSVNSTPAGIAGIANGTLTIAGAGEVTVTATQSGDNNYNTAGAAVISFTVRKAAATLALVADDLTQTYDGNAKTVGFTIDPTAAPVTVTYAQGGNPVASPTNAGSYQVVASLSNANYEAANATGTLVIEKAAQTISFTKPADKVFGAAPFELVATATSGLGVSFEVSGPATLAGNQLTITGAGNVTVTATQGGNNNYNAAADVARTFTVARAGQTITFAALGDKAFGDAAFALSASATSGLPVSFSVAALLLFRKIRSLSRVRVM
jgi:hypothetical protein